MINVVKSKITGQYGNIVNITETKVILDFTNEGSPIAVSFNDFIKYCECDPEALEIVKQKKAIYDEICNALHE